MEVEKCERGIFEKQSERVGKCNCRAVGVP